MTARQTLDRAVSRVTGKDIRLVGNWSRLWCLDHSAPEIADELGVNVDLLKQCRDIVEIMELIEHRWTSYYPPAEGNLLLFAS